MINHKLAQDAFRARAESLVVATTGSATLSATPAGYARASGSFVTDGFVKGMEVSPTAFTQTTPGIVTAVAPLLLTISGGRTVQSSGSGRTLSVGLPLMRAYENDQFVADATRPYVTEEFVPGGTGIKTFPRRIGRFQEDGLSVWSWYGITGVGKDALTASVDALMRLFTPATLLPLSDGSSIDIPGDAAVYRSQIRRIESWAVITVQIPWRAHTRNVVAA